MFRIRPSLMKHISPSSPLRSLGNVVPGLLVVLLAPFVPLQAQDYRLTWSEEFNGNGKPSSADWNFEHGFVRNHEYQWYQEDNALVADGFLTIEGRHQRIENPHYAPPANAPSEEPESNTHRRRNNDWRTSREFAEYTSASINTRGKHEWLYGRFEIRAKIPTQSGAWPAIWTLGVRRPWPVNGEIDIMEYYRRNGRPHILANAAWAPRPNQPIWHTEAVPFTHFTDKDSLWAEKFHIWRMDWDEDSLHIYLDDELLNAQSCDVDDGAGFHPFRQPHYLLLNLAIGGDNGGEPIPSEYPIRYVVDYVRIYQTPAQQAAQQALLPSEPPQRDKRTGSRPHAGRHQ